MKAIWRCIWFLAIGGVAVSAATGVTKVSATSGHDTRFAMMRKSMVEQQIKRRGIRDEEVLNAMLSVPRHLFVPEPLADRAYDDSPLPIGYGQTISQPYIVAYMTEVLALDDESVVLEIGTGSGYQAAILSELVKKVHTIEIISELAESAARRLLELGFTNVEVKEGDGYYGWPEHAPYDAIIVTAAAGHIPPPLIAQLKKNGRMIIPVGGVFMTQNLVLVTKDYNGRAISRNMMPVLFVPLTGEH